MEIERKGSIQIEKRGTATAAQRGGGILKSYRRRLIIRREREYVRGEKGKEEILEFKRRERERGRGAGRCRNNTHGGGCGNFAKVGGRGKAVRRRILKHFYSAQLSCRNVYCRGDGLEAAKEDKSNKIVYFFLKKKHVSILKSRCNREEALQEG